jgi:hypothetical protein
LKRKTGIEHITISDLLFADDGKIVATSAEDLQEMLDIFVEITEALDMAKFRLSRMSFAFAKLRKRVFLNRNIHLVTKLRIFDTVVITNGLYGCAIWNINQKQLKKLDSWKFIHLKEDIRD